MADILLSLGDMIVGDDDDDPCLSRHMSKERHCPHLFRTRKSSFSARFRLRLCVGEIRNGVYPSTGEQR